MNIGQMPFGKKLFGRRSIGRRTCRQRDDTCSLVLCWADTRGLSLKRAHLMMSLLLGELAKSDVSPCKETLVSSSATSLIPLNFLFYQF